MATIELLETIPLVEPAEFRDIFSCGLHRIEFISSCARFVFFNESQSGGRPVRLVIPETIIMPADAILAAVRMTERASARQGMRLSKVH